MLVFFVFFSRFFYAIFFKSTVETIQTIYMSVHEWLKLNILLTCFFLVSPIYKMKNTKKKLFTLNQRCQIPPLRVTQGGFMINEVLRE